MHVDDVSPMYDTTTVAIGRSDQSVSGITRCVATSSNGRRAYLGSFSGVWRSDDGGVTWWHPEWTQPPAGQVAVPGALLVPNVYDLLVSPLNADVVCAATGRDARRPDQSGIYRSTDGGRTWARVHQFVSSSNVIGVVGSLAAAPDDPQRWYAGGGSAVALSTDGGQTWRERAPQTWASDRVYYVAAGPQHGGERDVYAVGTRVWHSTDGGETWQQDPAGPSLGSPADTTGPSARSVSIHPRNPKIVYVAAGDQLWRGDFSRSGSGNAAIWTLLPSPPIGYAGTTASGATFVVVHASPAGELLFLMSDRRTVHLAVGEPTGPGDWTRIDGGDVHIDPHGLACTPTFGRTPAAGRIYMVNDGGVNVSADGARTWTQGKGVSTLNIINCAVLPRVGGVPALCLETGHNNGFFSGDGGQTWRTQEYVAGDNDACFADPRQPNRLLVFAPRYYRLNLYVAPVGQVPNGAVGTQQRQFIPEPRRMPAPIGLGWNAISSFYLCGYRPLVLTLANEAPRPDGDFVTVCYTDPSTRVVLRTTAMSQITRPEDWITDARAEGPGVKVFQQGPVLPDPTIDILQASGGHERPTFYVGNPEAPGGRRLWKWTAGMASWQLLVPGPVVGGRPTPAIARRFFVDPYRPNVVYVLDADHIRRSDDGGTSWTVDQSLEWALTEHGAFPFDIGYDAVDFDALLRDMVFDPTRPGCRFALGPAGIFSTLDGANWTHLVLASAMGMRPVSAAYDRYSDSGSRALYVATSRGLLRLGPLPPDWDFPIGSVRAAAGRITYLRVHDVGTRYGPPGDQLDAEAIIMLDTEPEKAFGFELRGTPNEQAARGMLALLRDAFNDGRRVQIDFVRAGGHVGRILRAVEAPGA